MKKLKSLINKSWYMIQIFCVLLVCLAFVFCK
jgi:hypothetical protein